MGEQGVLALDIGGTKLAAALVSDDGSLRSRAQVPTPSSPSADVVYEALIEVAGEALAGGAARAVGVGCGGPMQPDGETVSPLNIQAWRAFPLRERLEASLGLPVRIDNDAKALALGEGWLGAARGCRNYLAMVVSTGVGAGIVVDGRLLDGAQGNAGHLGHLVVVPGGRRCACGVRGCLEAEASGTGIEATTGSPAREAGPDVVERTGMLVGMAVASAVTLLDLELACVAGSVALGFGQPFFEAANRSLAEHTGLSYTRGARIVPAGLGAAGPLTGAAALWLGEAS